MRAARGWTGFKFSKDETMLAHNIDTIKSDPGAPSFVRTIFVRKSIFIEIYRDLSRFIEIYRDFIEIYWDFYRDLTITFSTNFYGQILEDKILQNQIFWTHIFVTNIYIFWCEKYFYRDVIFVHTEANWRCTSATTLIRTNVFT
jgi:hypothetical protein